MTPEQIIADALSEVWTTDQHEHWPEYIAAALRAAGLLPGPDTITVNREDLAYALEQIEDSALVIPNHFAGTYERLRAALLEPPAPKEQQPPPPRSPRLPARRTIGPV